MANIKEKLKKAYEFSNSWAGTVVIVLLVIFFIAQAFVIPSGSMKNTMLIGDYLFVKKYVYGVPTPTIPWLEIPILPDFDGDGHIIKGDGPKRGDIVIFRYPMDERIHYVKRCVATGGDVLFVHNKDFFLRPVEGDEFIEKNYSKEQIVDINGILFVRNPYQNEHKGIHHSETTIDDGRYAQQIFNFPPIEVPEGEYFMMGDNRDNSTDSRWWGTVPYKLIVGTPWFIYFSWNNKDKDENTSNDYLIRWDRIGKTVEELEKQL
jgi:signal peptidase I